MALTDERNSGTGDRPSRAGIGDRPVAHGAAAVAHDEIRAVETGPN